MRNSTLPCATWRKRSVKIRDPFPPRLHTQTRLSSTNSKAEQAPHVVVTHLTGLSCSLSIILLYVYLYTVKVGDWPDLHSSVLEALALVVACRAALKGRLRVRAKGQNHRYSC